MGVIHRAALCETLEQRWSACRDSDESWHWPRIPLVFGARCDVWPDLGEMLGHRWPCTSPRLRPSCSTHKRTLPFAWPRWHCCTGDSWQMQGGR